VARIPYVDPEQAPERVRAVLTQLPAPLHVFRLMAHAETSFRAWVRLGATILSRQALPANLRELAILQVARLSPAEYEWVQHVPIARRTGVTDDQIEALRGGREEVDCFDARERAVLRFAAELVAGPRASDTAYAAVAAHLPPREIVELVLAVGFYMLMARLMETADIDLEPPAGERILEQLQEG